jgi:hypothetical protein
LRDFDSVDADVIQFPVAHAGESVVGGSQLFPVANLPNKIVQHCAFPFVFAILRRGGNENRFLVGRYVGRAFLQSSGRFDGQIFEKRISNSALTISRLVMRDPAPMCSPCGVSTAREQKTPVGDGPGVHGIWVSEFSLGRLPQKNDRPPVGGGTGGRRFDRTRLGGGCLAMRARSGLGRRIAL